MKIVNRKASYDYFLLEKFEAGIILSGAEVKSIKNKGIILTESFVQIRDGEAWLYNAHISPYPFSDNRDYDPQRTRKLLLHQREILKISQKMKEKSLTVVPVSCYTRGRNIKLEIALARGKKEYEKRELIKKRDAEKEIKKLLKNKGSVKDRQD